MFDDSFRDKVKGDPSGTGHGWVQGDGNAGNVVSGIYGLERGDNPNKQVNYVTCHDNYALADKLIESGVSQTDLGNASVLSNGIILSSQGITFLHAGEEILRSKPIYENGIWTGEYSHNSYNLPDISNSLKWENKIIYADAYNAYKDLVHISTSQSAFHFTTKEQSQANYLIKVQNAETIVVEITTPSNLKDSDDWSKIIIIYSSGKGTNTSYTVSGNWNVATVSGTSNVVKGATVTGQVTLGTYSIAVLYQE